jgi:hypothetical protein
VYGRERDGRDERQSPHYRTRDASLPPYGASLRARGAPLPSCDALLIALTFKSPFLVGSVRLNLVTFLRR